MNRARAALAEATAELRAGQAKRVAHDPEQRHVGADVEVVTFAVDFENHGHIILRGHTMTRRHLLLTIALCTSACRTSPRSATVTLAVAGMI